MSSRNSTKNVQFSDYENIQCAVDRLKIDEERKEPELITVQRNSFKNTKADISQVNLVRFPPVIIPVSSAPSNATYSADIKLGQLVSSDTIAFALQNGAYAMRLNIKKHKCAVSNMNNEISGTYDLVVVGSQISNGQYHYDLENVNRPLAAQKENGNIFETSTMPMAQPLSTIIYSVMYDFNQIRAITSNVQAELTLDSSVEAEVIFSYANLNKDKENSPKDQDFKEPAVKPAVKPRSFF